ncbi:MAG: hypothetical protein CM15mP81_15710 [Alphaproteobacteria bacterium]|nr:MAG: hypothetical protein CM15mP81_15710 [Alphaproteobacteria bacterium]
MAFADNKVDYSIKWYSSSISWLLCGPRQRFYADEGLEVTILPGGPDVVPHKLWQVGC